MAAVYLSDPAVAAHYHVAPGEWVTVPDDDEVASLISQRHGWSIDAPALPAAGYVHRDAPPFVPYGTAAPKAAPKAAPPKARA